MRAFYVSVLFSIGTKNLMTPSAITDLSVGPHLAVSRLNQGVATADFADLFIALMYHCNILMDKTLENLHISVNHAGS